MKRIIRTIDIVKGLIIIGEMISIGYLQLLPIEIAGDFTTPLFSFAVGIVATVFAFSHFNKSRNNLLKYLHKYGIYIFLCAIIILFNLIYTIIIYEYNLRDIIIAIEPYLFFVYVFPVIYCLDKEKVTNSIFNTMASLVIIIIIIKFITWLLYYQSGIVLFERLLFQYKDWTRSGFQRIETGTFFSCTMAILLYKSVRSRQKVIARILLIILITFAVIVSRSRIQIAAIFIALGIELFFLLSSKRKILYGFFLISVIAILAGSGFINAFLESFSTNNFSYTNSNSARYASITHYMHQYWIKNPILGLGMLISTNDKAALYMIKYETTHYFLDDLGALGSIVRFGIGGIILYLLVYTIYIKACFRVKKQSFGPIIIGTLSYTMLYGIVSNVFDLQRAIETFIYLGLSLYILFNTKVKKYELYCSYNCI